MTVSSSLIPNERGLGLFDLHSYSFDIEVILVKASEDEVPGWPSDTNGFQREPVIVSGTGWNLIHTTDESSQYRFYSLEKQVTKEELQEREKLLNTLFLHQDAWLPPLEYWLSFHIDPEIDLAIFEAVNAISYKPIM